MSDTAREQILAAVGRLARSGQCPFTVQDVVSELQPAGTQLAESTIGTHVTSRMCTTSPDHHGTTYNDLDRVAKGEYRLRRG